MDADEPKTGAEEVLTTATLEALLGVAKEELTQAAGASLAAVLLYGSAAGGGWKGGRSNVNLLVVLKSLDVGALRKIAPRVASWADRTFVVHVTTLSELSAYARVFPIHLLELQDHHRVLAGDDPVASIEVKKEHLLASAERELRDVTRAMIRSTALFGEERRAISGAVRRHFRALVYALRGVLRYLGKLPPTTDKHPTLEAAAKELALDHAMLLDLLAFRRRMKPITPAEVDRLAEGLLVESTKAADRVAALSAGAANAPGSQSASPLSN